MQIPIRQLDIRGPTHALGDLFSDKVVRLAAERPALSTEALSKCNSMPSEFQCSNDPSMAAFSQHYRVKTCSGTRSCLDLEGSPVVDDVRNDDLVERVPYILGEWKSIVKLTMRGMLTNSLESQPCPCAAPVHHLADETDVGKALLPHHPLAIPL